MVASETLVFFPTRRDSNPFRAAARLSEGAVISDRGCVLWGPALSCRWPVLEEACTLPARCPQPWVTLG